MAKLNKEFTYQIFTKDGKYITTWTDVTSDPKFTKVINGGVKELMVKLARPFSNFGEGNDVYFENQLRLYVFDKEAPDGRLLYTGRLNEYRPTFSKDGQYVDVQFIGYVSEFEDRYLRDTKTDLAVGWGNVSVSVSGLQQINLGRPQGTPVDSTDVAYAATTGAEFPYQSITGVDFYVAKHASTPDQTFTCGIMAGDFRIGTNQQTNVQFGYYQPGNVIASGVVQSSTLPSTLDSFQLVHVDFPKPLYTLGASVFYPFVAGSGISVGWNDQVNIIGQGNPLWTKKRNVATDVAPLYRQDNGDGWMRDLVAQIYFGNLAPEFTSIEVTDMLAYMLNYQYSGTIKWNSSNRPTGALVSYQFNKQKVSEAINKAKDLAPPNWYWYVNADNQFIWKYRDDNVIDHTLTLGQEVLDCRPIKSVNEMKTRVIFYGGASPGEPELFLEDDRDNMQPVYTLKEQLIQDGRVTDQTTARLFTKQYFDAYGSPATVMQITVMDSNGDTRLGYDIESFEVGQRIQLIDPTNDNYQTVEGVPDVGFYLDQTPMDIQFTNMLTSPFQIVQIDYSPDSVLLTLSNAIDSAPKRIEDIDRNQQQYITQNSPLG
jgi:hypothetical protein